MADSEIQTMAKPASLYVGDLHSDVTDDLLYKAFSEFKSLISVRVCRDSVTAKSLCYGYVNFTSHQEAIRAIELKNHSLLNGKVIRVMWSSRDADARKSGRGNVFVKNLAESIDNLGLHDLFQKYGKILSSKIVMSEDGKSKGYGYIQFDSEESANDAIQKMNGSTVGDKQIYVGKFIRKNITKEHLQEKFSSFGKIISLAIAKDGNGLSKGFGFVNYDNPDDARRAMEAMNGSQFGSKNLYVARAQKKVEREQILHHLFVEKCKGSNIYVKNIDDSVSDEELRNQFSACGTILSAKIMRDDKGISKGFGFVCFSTLDEAVKSVNSFNGCMFHGKPLYVAFAQKKELLVLFITLRDQDGVLMALQLLLKHFNNHQLLLFPSMVSSIGMNDNMNSKESSTHSVQAKHVASGCQLEMEDKAGISSAMQVLHLQKTKVSGQDVLHSNSIAAEVAVI
ncbi:hypothetical protein P8452_07905 [Trifolium repens]|nr:hypothetical protein P8452_07905 [Trifolium repens]